MLKYPIRSNEYSYMFNDNINQMNFVAKRT